MKDLPGRDTESDVRDLDAEQPNAEWLRAESDRRREVDDRRKSQERVARMARRASEPLSKRLFEVEKAMVLAPTPQAVRGGGSGGSRARSMPPPRAAVEEAGGADPAEVSRIVRIVEDCLKRLEDVVDGMQGKGVGRQNLTSSDLDKILAVEYLGWSPEDVATVEPALGSPAAVRKSRELLNLHRETGEPLPKRQE